MTRSLAGAADRSGGAGTATEATRPTGSGTPSSRHPVAAGRHRALIAAAFLAPALLLLGVLVAYPVVYSVWRSLYDAAGTNFLGLGNYVTMFTDPATFISIRNNVIWVLVVPVSVTIIGLIFAVLMDRIKWGTAFKLIVFMPMAISMVAAGVIFRTTFQENPNLGLVNATLVGIHNAVGGGSVYPNARPRENTGLTTTDGAVLAANPVSPGSMQDFPLIGVTPKSLPGNATVAVAAPQPAADAIAGTVWLDFVRGGGGTAGALGDGKKGLPGIEVNAVNSAGTIVGTTRTADDGSYVLAKLPAGAVSVTLPASNFSAPYAGVSWLGPTLVTAVVILSYIWIWAGFAMVMIASGLSAMDRSLQEAARMDGANEWQVFRRITAPLLSPVLIVVFVTLIVNVLKIFDLVYVIPPPSSLPAATVIAVQMWTVSFGGGNDQGLGSALSILLLVLVLPFMIINVRRFRSDRDR
ncbi:ABC transporter permease [Glaciibacter psychrotolerans]|uniref:Alpha-glucoside transport system permease protein n=1 Tax=Glaciibacter psychrotolerans TaxID=670054 RepID=A0A7Z0EFL4_9MICO|nr:ABC transporter permease subunit [Leifsonia psychrotolerans]NYJ20625.1 alpha-glucoside transport system permease protein [Leifsonia psychrotolerans]